MIYRRHIIGSLNTSAFTVFTVLLAITLSVIAVRVLDNAAWGKIDQNFVMVYLVLSFFSASPYLVQMTAVMSILQTFLRLYADSEMVIWEGSGMPLFRWIKPITPWLLWLMVVVAVLVLLIRPWSIGVSRQLDSQYRQGQVLLKTSPGIFHSLGEGRSTLYVESGQDDKALRHIFLFQQAPATSPSSQPAIHMAIAERGSMLATQNSLMQLHQGMFYHLQWVPQYLGIGSFAHLNLNTINPYQNEPDKTQAIPTLHLVNDISLEARGELIWRISMIIQTWVMGLFALMFSYSAPRKRNYMSFIVILSVGMIYYNLSSVLQSFISQGRIHPWLGLISLHLAFTIIAILGVLARSYRFSWRRLLASLMPHRAPIANVN